MYLKKKVQVRLEHDCSTSAVHIFSTLAFPPSILLKNKFSKGKTLMRNNSTCSRTSTENDYKKMNHIIIDE
jgi:hypothetical protein